VRNSAVPSNASADANALQRMVMVLVLLFAWGGFAGLLGYDLKISYDHEYSVARRDADNLTQVLERHLTAMVEKIDIVLRNVADDYQPILAGAQPRPERLKANRALLHEMEVIPEAQTESLRIIDAGGRVIYNAGNTDALPGSVVVADRAYFLRQKHELDAGLVISEPIFSRFTSSWVFVLSRRLSAPDGRFLGVVQAAVRADMVQSLFENLNLGRRGSIALYDTDLRLFARHPVEPEQLGKAYPLTQISTALLAGEKVGNYTVSSRVDGVTRDYTFRKLDNQPFVVLVGLSSEDFLVTWWRKVIFYAISLGAMTLELAGLILLQQKASRDRIRHLATHDILTNLPNRLSLEEELAEDLSPMAVLALDLDHFKNVNDSLGHELGDRLLRMVAKRLRHTLRDSDTVSRHGGDEFVVLLKDPRPDMVPSLAQRLLDEVSRPYVVDDRELVLTASMGISLCPQDGTDIGTLLKNADAAMFQAKAAGRNNFQFFTPDMNARLAERLDTENSLRKALDKGELSLRYQPQFQTSTRQLIGFEALLRWHHPERGLLPPGRFVPIAEETGLIVPIGAWVLKEACRQNKAWQDQGLAPVVMAVNISAVQFRQQDLVQTVTEALQESGLEPRWLELEVTESVLMHDIEHVIAVLHQLKALGVHLSIDDFGTGYSSLSYLKRFPIDKIKIDQSFVRDVHVSDDDAAIVQTVIAIAGKMGMRAIAEGVETAVHLDAMHSFGCDEVQGYLFSPAVSPDEALGFFHGPAEVKVRV
jgi:diguanylate cyclase (GGDEF)-like protein